MNDEVGKGRAFGLGKAMVVCMLMSWHRLRAWRGAHMYWLHLGRAAQGSNHAGHQCSGCARPCSCGYDAQVCGHDHEQSMIVVLC